MKQYILENIVPFWYNLLPLFMYLCIFRLYTNKIEYYGNKVYHSD